MFWTHQYLAFKPIAVIAGFSAESPSGIPYIYYYMLGADGHLVLGLGCGNRGILVRRVDWTEGHMSGAPG